MKKSTGTSYSKKQKQDLDRLLNRLSEYLRTPEGIALSDQVEELFSRIHSQAVKQTPELTEVEEYALRFILRSGVSLESFRQKRPKSWVRLICFCSS